ncbi:MAG: hypothetical protein ACTSPY_01545 [Candidatus Helarchaeota archaeon]
MEEDTKVKKLEKIWETLLTENLSIVEDLCSDDKCYTALSLLFKSGFKAAVKTNNKEIFTRIINKLDDIFSKINEKNIQLLNK